jgi:DivIVA domain-containing protein
MTRLFRTVGKLQKGYDPEEVDAFFERARRVYEGDQREPLTSRDVQQTVFELVRGGYSTSSVDAAMDRLERAFVVRQRAEFVAEHGQQAWMEHLAALARTLYGRLTRADGERFAPPPRGQQGYLAEDVDDLCHRLVDYFDNGQSLTSEEVRNTVFRRARGSDAYAEPAVDAFCARAVEVLLGVE